MVGKTAVACLQTAGPWSNHNWRFTCGTRLIEIFFFGHHDRRTASFYISYYLRHIGIFLRLFHINRNPCYNGGAYLYALLTKFAAIDKSVLLSLVLVYCLGEVSEYALAAAGIRRTMPSGRSLAGAFTGGKVIWIIEFFDRDVLLQKAKPEPGIALFKIWLRLQETLFRRGGPRPCRFLPVMAFLTLHSKMGSTERRCSNPRFISLFKDDEEKRKI